MWNCTVDVIEYKADIKTTFKYNKEQNMLTKLLTTAVVLGISISAAQANTLSFNGSYDVANEIDYFMFENNSAGNVDMIMNTGAYGYDADMVIWSKVAGSTVVGQPGDSEWALVKWAPAAERFNDLTISTNIYGIEMFDHNAADPNPSGVSDPGESLNLAAGTYLLSVTGGANWLTSSVEGGELLSAAQFRGIDHFFETTYPNPYGISVIGDVSEVSAVPVPAAVWLFGSALAGLGAVRRQKTAIA